MIYDEDHEALRGSVKEFLDREVVPHLEEHAEAHALPGSYEIMTLPIGRYLGP